MSSVNRSLGTPGKNIGVSRQNASRNALRGDSRRRQAAKQINVSNGERAFSLAAGSILALLGVNRRDLTGLLIACTGGALIYRGATGRCHAYGALGIDTAPTTSRPASKDINGIQLRRSIMINKTPEELYAFWRKFENLPTIMSHLKSVRSLDDRRSHWVAEAPSIAGGPIEWDAEITSDEPNKSIAWQSLTDSTVEHRGSVEFTRAPADRGTMIRVTMEYRPPAGRIGKWVAAVFGESPEQQIREDLRNFKRIMEIGEAPTVTGQSHGMCNGAGMLGQNQ